MVLPTPLACSLLEENDFKGNAKSLSSAIAFPQCVTSWLDKALFLPFPLFHMGLCDA